MRSSSLKNNTMPFVFLHAFNLHTARAPCVYDVGERQGAMLIFSVSLTKIVKSGRPLKSRQQSGPGRPAAIATVNAATSLQMAQDKREKQGKGQVGVRRMGTSNPRTGTPGSGWGHLTLLDLCVSTHRLW